MSVKQCHNIPQRMLVEVAPRELCDVLTKALLAALGEQALSLRSVPGVHVHMASLQALPRTNVDSRPSGHR